ncbi:glycosyltransferase family 32 protein [Lactobacillus helveticus]|uniref:glycosyltransferase family 32 protein n=1 Tax=Lactobacillus helveticus TaxID=1587 RepID=UPI001561C878|nr:glycosyltransferase [Lactobacillus helveticus]NRO27420.1 hypothetical protein [Lactobacillus helveticus]
MISKVINYCWFGKAPIPNKVKKCIDSWKKYFPDYEIKQWNESNFDINCCSYVREAYKLKKWAFVSDYARFKILYENGGVYFDTDIEVIKDMHDIIESGPFMGYESFYADDKINLKKETLVNPGVGLAAEKGMDIYKEILNYYEKQHFLNSDGSINYATVVERVTEILRKNGLIPNGKMQKVKGITIYPSDYFCPLNHMTGKLNITDNTRSIHLYTASWQSKGAKLKKQIKKWMPPFILNLILRIKRHE